MEEMIRIRDYCCAVCWSHLEQMADGGVACARYRYEHAGYVTKTYAERRRSDSAGEAAEVRAMLRQAGVLPEDTRSVDEILKSLGF